VWLPSGLFKDKVKEAIRERRSVLCVGLDPALPNQRRRNTIPKSYLESADDAEARLNFCLDVVDKVSGFCSAIKVNEQYLKGLNLRQHLTLTKRISEKGLVCIYDLKIGDIGESVRAGLFHVKAWGYNAVTFNPLPGNLKEVLEEARREKPIGVLTLTLMSNPESEKYFLKTRVNGKPLYLEVAEEVRRFNGDGCVVGATGHVTKGHIMRVRETVGPDRVVLFPGVGAQGGDVKKIIEAGGEVILINVGRDIIYSKNPSEKAEKYREMFNSMRRALGW